MKINWLPISLGYNIGWTLGAICGNLNSSHFLLWFSICASILWSLYGFFVYLNHKLAKKRQEAIDKLKRESQQEIEKWMEEYKEQQCQAGNH